MHSPVCLYTHFPVAWRHLFVYEFICVHSPVYSPSRVFLCKAVVFWRLVSVPFLVFSLSPLWFPEPGKHLFFQDRQLRFVSLAPSEQSGARLAQDASIVAAAVQQSLQLELSGHEDVALLCVRRRTPLPGNGADGGVARAPQHAAPRTDTTHALAHAHPHATCTRAPALCPGALPTPRWTPLLRTDRTRTTQGTLWQPCGVRFPRNAAAAMDDVRQSTFGSQRAREVSYQNRRGRAHAHAHRACLDARPAAVRPGPHNPTSQIVDWK